RRQRHQPGPAHPLPGGQPRPQHQVGGGPLAFRQHAIPDAHELVVVRGHHPAVVGCQRRLAPPPPPAPPPRPRAPPGPARAPPPRPPAGLPVTIALPRALKRALSPRPLCGGGGAAGSPVTAPQRRTIRSPPAVSTRSPAGLKATCMITPPWASGGDTG